VPRKAFGPYPAPQPGEAGADDGALPQATVQLRPPKNSSGSYLKQPAAGAKAEAALFVAVQAVMIACIVTVAAQLFATV
jgi:hypothetical protein